jgi:hypothetical protein
MREITEQTIKNFMVNWYNDLTWQVSQTVMDASMPILDADQLYNQPFGQDLQMLGMAADGELVKTFENVDEVIGVIQKLAEWMFARPGQGAMYEIPASFWQSEIGWVALQAYLWAHDDELITITEAAKMLGKTISTVSSMVQRGQLTGYSDPNEHNPRRQTRLSKIQVEEMQTNG